MVNPIMKFIIEIERLTQHYIKERHEKPVELADIIDQEAIGFEFKTGWVSKNSIYRSKLSPVLYMVSDINDVDAGRGYKLYLIKMKKGVCLVNARYKRYAIIGSDLSVKWEANRSGFVVRYFGGKQLKLILTKKLMVRWEWVDDTLVYY